jgi:hypothetical protein
MNRQITGAPEPMDRTSKMLLTAIGFCALMLAFLIGLMWL